MINTTRNARFSVSVESTVQRPVAQFRWIRSVSEVNECGREMSEQKDQHNVNEELWRAVDKENVDAVLHLLENRGDPNYRSTFDDDGKLLEIKNVNLLMVACYRGKKTIYELLLERGASINETDSDGWTALHWGSMQGHDDIVRYLLEKQAIVDAVSKDGNTPLHIAASNQHHGIVQLLFANKANPDIPNKDGNTPLHIAASNQHHGIVQLLFANKANPDIPNKDGNTPLHIAASNPHHGIVQLLFANKANPDIPNKDGNTPLHIAAFSQYHGIVQLVIENKANPDLRNEVGNTPLHFAAECKNDGIVQHLIEINANPDIQNKDGNTPLHLAARERCDGIVQLLVVNKANPNIPNKDGDTPLHFAAKKRHGGIVQSLIENNGNPDVQNKYGDTPLHLAARGQCDGIVKLLIEDNANPDIQNKNGNTPLHLAAEERHGGIVELLLENKVNPDIQNKKGKYPHHLAWGALRQRMLAYWEVYRVAPLLDMGSVSPNTIKGFVVGSSKAGKTTFTRAVTGIGDPWNVLECTPGIDIMEVGLDQVGLLKMHDVAGHDLFHTTHTFFFGGVSALFTYVANMELSRKLLLADVIYWLAFICSGRSPHSPPVYILILGSRGGGEDQEARQFMLNSVTKEIRKKFGDRFIFILGDKSLVLDMRLAGSKEMEEVKKQLAIGVQNCLKRVPDIPFICHQVRADVLPQLRDEKAAQSSELPSGQFTEKSEFHALVVKVSDALKDPSLFASLLYYLEEWGEIVVTGSRLVINPLWLCRSLIAPVLASKADPKSIEFRIRIDAKADGTATLEEIARALEDFRELNKTPAVDPKAGIDILCHMGLALPTEKNDVFRFPVLIQDSKPDQVWMKTESTEPHGMIYVGIRLQCQSEIEVFTPAVMPLLQSEVANRRSEMEVIMWKGGMLVERICEPSQPKVEALVFISDKPRAIHAIDLIARGRAHCHQDTKQLLDKMQHITMQILDKMCPGTLVGKCYLSYHQITEHVDKPIAYSQEEVDAAKKGTGVLAKTTDTQIIQDSVVDMLVVDDDHIIYNLQALSKHCSDHWQDLGCILLSSAKSKVVEIAAELGDAAKTDDKFCHVMETWIRRQWRTATLNTFLLACDEVDSRLRRLVETELSMRDRRNVSYVNIEESVDQGEAAATSELIQPVAGGMDVSEVRTSVIKHSSDKWYQIGRALDLAPATINGVTYDKPDFKGKLLAVIDKKEQESGKEGLRTELLEACFKVDPAIGEAVKQELLKLKKANQQ